MQCKFIIKNVSHAAHAKRRTSTFLLIEPDEHLLPVLSALGAAYVDSDSMSLFMRAQTDSKMPVVLLVSIDGKFIVVRERARADWGDGQEEWIAAPPELADFEFPWVPRLLDAFNGALKNSPALAAELGVKSTDLLIPQRVHAASRESLTLERFESGITSAFSDPESASTNELILAIVASRARQFEQIPKSAKLAMREEFERRLQPEHNFGAGYEHFYMADGLTFNELRERQKRVIANFKKLSNHFPNDLMNIDDSDVRHWLEANFDLDELLELSVYAWFTVDMPHAREKVLIMTTEECLRSPERE